MRGNKMFFHVGLPKTGTTYLQRYVFPKIDEIYFGNVEMLFGMPVTKSGNKPVLYSNERLTDGFFSENGFVRVEQILDNIKEIYGDIGIIIGFRPQDEFVLSSYCQYIKTGGDIDIDDFYNTENNEKAIISDDKLRWSKWLQMIDKKFSNVFVYTNKILREDLDSFLVSLSKFMDIDEIRSKSSMLNKSKNRSISKQWALATLRRTNRINRVLGSSPLPSLNNRLFRVLGITPRRLLQNRLHFIGKKQFRLPDEMESHLKTKFQSDWQYIESRVDCYKKSLS